jgi:SAM-dependent methyltransferase
MAAPDTRPGRQATRKEKPLGDASPTHNSIVALPDRPVPPDAVPAPESEPASQVIRLQADEHPLIEDAEPQTHREHALRLMHLRAYGEARAYATGRDVLDLGCNTGYGTLDFVDVARRVVGIDVSPRAIDLARARAGAENAEFRVVDGIQLPFPDASFDLVTSFQVLEHIADPVPFLAEIRRVLRPGGTALLTTPNAAIRLDPGMKPWNRFHVREYTATELRELLQHAFQRVRIRGMFGTPTLYNLEIEAVDAARARTRRASIAGSQAPVRDAGRDRRPLPIRLARAALPGWVRARLRPLVRARRQRKRAATRVTLSPPAGSTASRVDLATFRAFTSDDLFYSDRDLDLALDFMAVCGLGSGAEPLSSS